MLEKLEMSVNDYDPYQNDGMLENYIKIIILAAYICSILA